jgi:hypothetical protein
MPTSASSPELRAADRGRARARLSERAGYEVSRVSSYLGRWMRHGTWYPTGSCACSTGAAAAGPAAIRTITPR